MLFLSVSYPAFCLISYVVRLLLHSLFVISQEKFTGKTTVPISFVSKGSPTKSRLKNYYYR